MLQKYMNKIVGNVGMNKIVGNVGMNKIVGNVGVLPYVCSSLNLRNPTGAFVLHMVIF